MILSLLRIAAGVGLLSYASWQDWRTREVSNLVWALLGGLGLALFATEFAMSQGDLLAALVLLPLGLLLVDVLWDREESGFQRTLSYALYGVAAGVTLLLILLFGRFGPEDQGLLRRAFGALIVVVLAYAFYFVGLLRGGADAKAFLCIGVLVPGYPALGALPLLAIPASILPAFELLFPFAMSTLMNAALLLLALPLSFLARNLWRGDRRWPQLLTGYKAPLDALPPFTWVLQDVEAGRVRYDALPRKEAGEVDLEGLRSLGVARVWITPQLPFLLPLTLGFVVTVLLGNLLLAAL